MTKFVKNEAGYVEYKMAKEMAHEYLNARKGDDRKKDPQDYLCNLVNTEFGVKGVCTRVLLV
jgi:hypothetical protein